MSTIQQDAKLSQVERFLDGGIVLTLDPALAAEIGLNEALILGQMKHYWKAKEQPDPDGHRWVYNTYEQWQEQFPFWSIPTIKRTILRLEELGIITSEQREIDKGNSRKHYRLSDVYLTLRSKRSDPRINLISPSDQFDPTLNEAKTSTKTSTNPLSFADREALIPAESRDTWESFCSAVNEKRVAKKARPSVHSANLDWLLQEVKDHKLTAEEINYGLRACMRAKGGIAENPRYFRKAALSQRDEVIDPRDSDHGVIETDGNYAT